MPNTSDTVPLQHVSVGVRANNTVSSLQKTFDINLEDSLTSELECSLNLVL